MLKTLPTFTRSGEVRRTAVIVNKPFSRWQPPCYMFSDLDPASYYLDSKYQFQCILMEY